MTPLKAISAALLVAAVATAAGGPLCASDLQSQRPYVGSIEFVGNEHISDGKLKSVMRTRESGFLQLFNKPRFRPDYLRYDLAAVEAFYRKNGYYGASARVVESRYDQRSNETHIVIGVMEGEQTIVEEVKIEGEMPQKPESVIKGLRLKQGAPFDSTLVGSDIYFIRNRMWDKGYVLAGVAASVEVAGYKAYLSYAVDKGPQMKVGAMEVTGNKVAGEKRIKDLVTLEPGDVFSLEKVYDSQQHLFDTSLFRQVNLIISDIDTLEREVDLRVQVEERKMSYLELGLGIGTEDNGRLAAEWGHRHLPGLGGKLQVEAELAYDVYREGRAELRNRFLRSNAAYTGPRFPGTRFQTAVDAFYEKDRNPQTVDYDVWGFGVHGRRRMGRHTILYLDFTDEFIERKIPPLEESSPFTRKKDQTRTLGVTLDRDARDDLLYPTSGTHRSISLEVAGGPLRKDNHFLRLVGSLSHYNRIGEGVVLATRARAGLGRPYGKSDNGRDPDGIPFEDRFYAGGSNSVRGYSENSLGPRLNVDDPGAIDPKTAALRGNAQGGEALLLTNVELRFPLWKRIKLGGVLFLDGGNVWENRSDITLDDFVPVRDMEGGGYTGENVTKYRYSFGLGIRYNTPIGPLRLDYGVPVSRTGEMDSFGMFHFNLGHAF